MSTDLNPSVRPTLSIRARLMVLASLVLLPLMIDRIHAIEVNRAERINAANRQVLILARQGVDAQREVAISSRAFLQVAARAHATFVASPEVCNHFLADMVVQVGWNTFSVADVDGRITCSSRPEAIGVDISDRHYFQVAKRTGDFVLSDYAIGRLSATPVAVALFPQRASDGTVTAVLIGVLDSTWIDRLAGTVAERPRSALFLVNGAGAVLAHHPDPGHWSGREFKDHPLVRAMLAQPDGVMVANGLDGVRRVFGFVQLPGTETRLAVGLDEGDILQSVNREMRYAYAQLAVIAVILLAALWFGGNHLIVRPIRLLALLADRLGRGDYKMRVGKRRWAAEFVPLVTALDDMADKILARHDEARAVTERLNELASRDQLSGLPNRRAFDAALATEWERAQLRGEAVALAMVDVDHFKLFNDHYGHVGGDACLRIMGEILAASVRSDLDLAARYGGEEFALLLPGLDVWTATKLAERLRAAIAERRLPHDKAPLGHVTVSIGVASFRPALGESPQVLVEAADTVLYTAKRRGRNAVVAHDPMAVLMAS